MLKVKMKKMMKFISVSKTRESVPPDSPDSQTRRVVYEHSSSEDEAPEPSTSHDQRIKKIDREMQIRIKTVARNDVWKWYDPVCR